MSALQPYRGPWDQTRATHLLNRAAFGSTPDEIAQAAAAGIEKTVDALLAFQPEVERFPTPETPEMTEQPRRELAKLTREERKKKVEAFTRANRDAIDQLRGWWVKRMQQSKYPLREKLTLFWHGHFATSANEVKATRLMLRQNQF